MNPTRHDIVFFDGECGLCHAFVKFVVRHDPAAQFLFAPLRGETFRQCTVDSDQIVPESVVLCDANGEFAFKSTAVASVLRRLDGPWPTVGTILGGVPRPLRDLGYDGVARIRRSLFARPSTACPLLPPDQAARFLP